MSTNTAPTFLDLFCGCGGFSLGFVAGGLRCLDGIEKDTSAHATHLLNLGGECEQPSADDIRDVSAEKYKGCHLDVIIGGPPCQPFARVGRAKLREIGRQANAHVHDERVTFYEHYLRFVDALRPRAFVMENVPDICRFDGRNIAEEIAITASNLGYSVRYTLLNAAWYGVPQLRERVVLIGLRRDLDLVPVFPSRTHRLVLPRGYLTARGADGEVPVLPPHDHYAGQPNEIRDPLAAVTVAEAIGDLPPITEHLVHMRARCGARRFTEQIRYAAEPANSYQYLMRSWPGMGGQSAPSDHVIRYTPRDYTTFRRMQVGDQYPEAYAVAIARFETALRREETILGRSIRPESSRYQQLFQSIVPPYDVSKFPNKWQKLRPEEPAHTLTAHLGKDTYSHIHPDDTQARMISVREAARLQSFPDSFRFPGSMNAAFRQIGNSVPPLMALAVAQSVRTQLESAQRRARRKHIPRASIKGSFQEATA